MQRLELKAYPTPKRSQNRYQHDSRFLAIYGHIPLRQEVPEVGQHFPPARRPKPRERLTHRNVQIRIHLVSSFAERIEPREGCTGYPHVTRGKLGSSTWEFPGNASGHAV